MCVNPVFCVFMYYIYFVQVFTINCNMQIHVTVTIQNSVCVCSSSSCSSRGVLTERDLGGLKDFAPRGLCILNPCQPIEPLVAAKNDMEEK